MRQFLSSPGSAAADSLGSHTQRAPSGKEPISEISGKPAPGFSQGNKPEWESCRAVRAAGCWSIEGMSQPLWVSWAINGAGSPLGHSHLFLLNHIGNLSPESEGVVRQRGCMEDRGRPISLGEGAMGSAPKQPPEKPLLRKLMAQGCCCVLGACGKGEGQGQGWGQCTKHGVNEERGGSFRATNKMQHFHHSQHYEGGTIPMQNHYPRSYPQELIALLQHLPCCGAELQR